MKTSPNGRKLIESFEGLILQSYDDYNDHIVGPGDTVHGTLTIGYGHTSAAGAPGVFLGQTITKEQADSILASDLEKVEHQVNNLVQVPINQNQFDSLVSFEFNTGGLGHSTLLKDLNAKDYHGAADQFLVWNKQTIHGVSHIVAGLVRRRQQEREMFLKDVSVATTPTPSWNPFINSIINLLANLFRKGK